MSWVLCGAYNRPAFSVCKIVQYMSDRIDNASNWE